MRVKRGQLDKSGLGRGTRLSRLVLTAPIYLMAAVLTAQSPPPRSGVGSILLTVRDTGPDPISRPLLVWVRAPMNGREPRLAMLAGKNRYRVDTLPEGTAQIEIACTRMGGGPFDRLNYQYFTIGIRGPVPFDTTVTIDNTGCDTRPIRQETRVFAGFYTAGFELSTFVPCHNDSWIIPSDTLGASHQSLARRAWAWVDVRQHVKWPKVEQPDQSNDRSYFVRWHGTMTGPDSYGHMGMSQFWLVVDSIIAVRKGDRSSCTK